MAKLLLTNRQDYYVGLHSEFQGNGFSRFHECKKNNILLCAYEKLNVQNCNFVEVDEGFIAISGTLIYKKNMGQLALTEMYRDFNGDVALLRDSCLGTFSVLICKYNYLYLFVDASNCYDLHYYYDDKKKEFLITNTYYHVQKMIHPSPHFELLEHHFAFTQQFAVDQLTPFENVFKLTATRFLKINLETNLFEVADLPMNYFAKTYDTFEQTAEQFSDLFKAVSYDILHNFKTVTLCSTGGMDSRTLLAACLANDIKPELLTWYGNNVFSNSFDGDITASEQYAKMFDLKLNTPNISEDENEILPDQRKGLRNRLSLYGENYIMFGSNPHLFKIFEQFLGTEIVVLGNGGELFRIEIPYGTGKNEYTLYEFLQLLLRHPSHDLYWNNIQAYEDKIYSYFLKVCAVLKLDIEHLSKNQCEQLLIYTGYDNNRIPMNIINLYTYETNLFNQKPLYDFIYNVSWEYKDHAKLMLANIKNLKSDLLDIPMLSRCQWVRINKKTLTKELTFEQKLTLAVKHCIKSEAMKPFLKKCRSLLGFDRKYEKNLQESKKSSEYSNYIVKLLEALPAYQEMHLKILPFESDIKYDPRMLYFLLLKLYMFDEEQIKNDE